MYWYRGGGTTILVQGREPNKVWAGGGGGVPPPGDLYHTLGSGRFPIPWVGVPPPALFFPKKKGTQKFFGGQNIFSGLRPENKWDPKILQKGRFLA